jgi:hypothetical protein
MGLKRMNRKQWKTGPLYKQDHPHRHPPVTLANTHGMVIVSHKIPTAQTLNNSWLFSKKKNFFFGDNGSWTHSLVFARQALYCLTYSASTFWVGYFWDRISLFAWVGLYCAPICASPGSWDGMYTPLHSGIDWERSPELCVCTGLRLPQSS